MVSTGITVDLQGYSKWYMDKVGLLSFFLVFSRAAPTAYRGSQDRGLIGAVASGLRLSASNSGSEPCLQPTPQLMATLDP